MEYMSHKFLKDTSLSTVISGYSQQDQGDDNPRFANVYDDMQMKRRSFNVHGN